VVGVLALCGAALADVIDLEIIGPSEVAENFSASYKAIAYYDDDSTRDVTNSALWAVEPNTYTSIDNYGVLTTEDISYEDQPVTILASYSEADTTIEADKAVTVFPICPTGTALSFDGIDDYVKVNKNHSLNFGSSIDFTMEAWIKAKPSQLKYPAIIGRRNPGAANGYIFFLWLDGRLASQLNDGRDTNYQSTSDDLRDDTWHYVAVTADRNAYLIFYVDGIQKGQNDISIKGNIDSVSDIFIGWEEQNPSATYFNGVIDEVRIYDRALSAQEIQANMHRRLQGNEPNLVGYWDLDEGEGQVVYDLSGNGNDGQLGSTPEADSSDPAWVDSDAPIGICSLYQIATMATERALGRKTALLEELLAALAQEWAAYEALEELFESGDYGDLNKGDIVTAKQKIHSAIQHEEQSIDALEKSIEKLKDALSALGYEPEPPPM